VRIGLQINGTSPALERHTACTRISPGGGDRMRRSFSQRIRILTPSAILIALAASCAGSGQPTGPDDARVCCECACSKQGIPCLAITVEGDEGGSCPDLCETECASHTECPSVQAIALCALAPPDEPGDGRQRGPCSEVLDELDECQDQQQQ
jgi:hypothetical protein